jgi:glutamate/aspartate transport system permease protein
MSYNWDWGAVVAAPYLSWFIEGVQWTLLVSIFGWIIALSVGSLIGIARTLPSRPIKLAALAYVSLFRNIPLLVQMFLWFYVLPELLPDAAGKWLKRDLPTPEFYTAVVCLGLFTAARVAEQLRSGIEALRPGQRHAGLALGLSLGQTYRYILLPNAFRIIIPVLTSEFLTIFKNSSVALAVGLLELTAQSRRVSEYTFHSYEALAIATAIYMLITTVCMLLMRVVEARSAVPGMPSLGRK